MVRARVVFWLVVTLAGAAIAHDADLLYARLEQGAGPGFLDEVITLTASTLAQLGPFDVDADGVISQADLDASQDALRAGVWDEVPLTAAGAPCRREREHARLDEGFITLEATFRCGEGELRQDFKVLRVLPTNYRVVLGSQLDGERGRRYAQGQFTALEISRPHPRGALDAERVSAGFDAGLKGLFALDTFSLLGLLFLTAGSFRHAAQRAFAIVLGALAALAGVSLIPLSVVASGATLVLGVRPGLAARWAALVALGLGVSLALRAGHGGLAAGMGFWLSVLALCPVLVGVLTPLGRILARRPAAQRRVRLALSAVALSALVVRLVAAV